MQAGGNTHQSCTGPAARGEKSAARCAEGIVTIGRNRPSACAEIVMGARSVDGRRHIAVPAQIRAEVTPERRRQHVRLIVVGGESTIAAIEENRGVVVLSRVAGCPKRMRPTEMHTIGGV